MSKLTDLMTDWMEMVKKDLIANYDKKNFRASGKFANDLEYKVGELGATLYSAKQAYWMENGRQPNKDQSKQGLHKFAAWAGSTFIKQWLKDKGLSGNPFAIAYKIGENGYSVSKRPNVISEVINDETLKLLTDNMRLYFISKIKSDILKNYK